MSDLTESYPKSHVEPWRHLRYLSDHLCYVTVLDNQYTISIDKRLSKHTKFKKKAGFPCAKRNSRQDPNSSAQRHDATRWVGSAKASYSLKIGDGLLSGSQVSKILIRKNDWVCHCFHERQSGLFWYHWLLARHWKNASIGIHRPLRLQAAMRNSCFSLMLSLTTRSTTVLQSHSLFESWRGLSVDERHDIEKKA